MTIEGGQNFVQVQGPFPYSQFPGGDSDEPGWHPVDVMVMSETHDLLTLIDPRYGEVFNFPMLFRKREHLIYSVPVSNCPRGAVHVTFSLSPVEPAQPAI